MRVDLKVFCKPKRKLLDLEIVGKHLQINWSFYIKWEYLAVIDLTEYKQNQIRTDI